jgi:hypothetical protein
VPPRISVHVASATKALWATSFRRSHQRCGRCGNRRGLRLSGCNFSQQCFALDPDLFAAQFRCSISPSALCGAPLCWVFRGRRELRHVYGTGLKKKRLASLQAVDCWLRGPARSHRWRIFVAIPISSARACVTPRRNGKPRLRSRAASRPERRKWPWAGCWATCLTVDRKQEVVMSKVTCDGPLTAFLVIDSAQGLVRPPFVAARVPGCGLEQEW